MTARPAWPTLRRSAPLADEARLPAWDGSRVAARSVTVKRGGQSILEVASLDVRKGEVLALIGPNGAGKSTLLQVLALLAKPDSGQVLFDGVRVTVGRSSLAYRRRMAVVFQEPLLLDTSVFDNVATGLRLRGVGRQETGRRVAKWLESFGIAGLARRSARTLSGGEAQRTSLARAFVLEPDLLLLDEPFSALDQPTRLALMQDLEALLRETAITTVFVTHDRVEALTIGDRVGVMIGGRIQDLGAPDRVFVAPATTEVAAFVGVENILPGPVVSADEGLATVAVGSGQVQVVADLRPGETVFLCLRPEEVTLALPAGRTVTSARNAFPGVVSRCTPLGSQWHVAVDCGFPLIALITQRSGVELGLAPGRPVVASFKASAVHTIRRDRS